MKIFSNLTCTLTCRTEFTIKDTTHIFLTRATYILVGVSFLQLPFCTSTDHESPTSLRFFLSSSCCSRKKVFVVGKLKVATTISRFSIPSFYVSLCFQHIAPAFFPLSCHRHTRAARHTTHSLCHSD